MIYKVSSGEMMGIYNQQFVIISDIFVFWVIYWSQNKNQHKTAVIDYHMSTGLTQGFREQTCVTKGHYTRCRWWIPSVESDPGAFSASILEEYNDE